MAQWKDECYVILIDVVCILQVTVSWLSGRTSAMSY